MEPLLFPSNKNNLSKQKKALKILLVDDNDSTNFFNKIVIERNIFAQITLSTNGLEALNHIKLLLEQNEQMPELILLDLNMPVMNGWGFLAAYKNLTPLYKSSKIVFNLSAELIESDKQKIKDLDINHIFVEKMMSKEIIEAIIS